MKMICKKIAAFRTIWCIMAILLANVTVYGEERTEAEPASENWYDFAADELYQRHIVNDLDNMDKTLSRGEMAQILINTDMFNTSSYTINPFDDLRSGDEYYSDICRLYWRGIYSGEQDESGDLCAKAEEPLTREQAVSFIVRAFGLNKSKNVYEIKDMDEVSAYAADDVKTGYSLGIVHGYDNGTFRPHNQVTKAEFLSMIYNASKLPSGLFNTEEEIRSTFSEEYRSENILCKADKEDYRFGEKIRIRFENKGNYDYYYGEEYQLEIKTDNGWMVVPFDRGDVDDPAFLISHKDETSISLDRKYDKLEKGKYRIVIIVTPDVDKSANMKDEFVSAEFSII